VSVCAHPATPQTVGSNVPLLLQSAIGRGPSFCRKHLSSRCSLKPNGSELRIMRETRANNEHIVRHIVHMPYHMPHVTRFTSHATLLTSHDTSLTFSTPATQSYLATQGAFACSLVNGRSRLMSLMSCFSVCSHLCGCSCKLSSK